MSTTLRYLSLPVLVSFAISFLSFSTFVLIPSLFGLEVYRSFAESNVYAGIFNAAIATSSSVFAINAAITGRSQLLKLYIYLSYTLGLGFILLFLALGETGILFLVLAYLVNIEISRMVNYIRQKYNNIKVLAWLILQPLLFLLLIIVAFFILTDVEWEVLFLISSLITLFVSKVYISDEVGFSFPGVTTSRVLGVGTIILSASLIPMVIQLDLLYFDYIRVDIAQYSVYHKVIYSIPIALTGLLIPTFVTFLKEEKTKTFIKSMFGLSVLSFVACLTVLLALEGFKKIAFDLDMAILGGVFSAVFTAGNIVISVFVVQKPGYLLLMDWWFIIILRCSYTL